MRRLCEPLHYLWSSRIISDASSQLVRHTSKLLHCCQYPTTTVDPFSRVIQTPRSSLVIRLDISSLTSTSRALSLSLTHKHTHLYNTLQHHHLSCPDRSWTNPLTLLTCQCARAQREGATYMAQVTVSLDSLSRPRTDLCPRYATTTWQHTGPPKTIQ